MRQRSAFSWVRLVLLLFPPAALSLFFLLRWNRRVMDFWVFQIAGPMEQQLACLCSLVPFSLFECTAAVLVLFTIWTLGRHLAAAVRRTPRSAIRVCLTDLITIWLWVLAALYWFWNTAYYASSFSQRSGLVPAPYSVEQLALTTEQFAARAAHLSKQVERDGSLHWSLSPRDCISRGTAVYGPISQEFPCLELTPQKVKPFVCSRLQSVLGYTGMYSPFTGEANINIDAPVCLIPATIAHEMAHQRMIASEAECNFIGIAACISCPDPVFQYSGYLSGLIHLSNALASVRPDLWNQIASKHFTPEMQTDWLDNARYWARFDSPAEDAAGQAYDAFLKHNQQELGLRSYGACVDLLVTRFLTSS